MKLYCIISYIAIFMLYSRKETHSAVQITQKCVCRMYKLLGNERPLSAKPRPRKNAVACKRRSLYVRQGTPAPQGIELLRRTQTIPCGHQSSGGGTPSLQNIESGGKNQVHQRRRYLDLAGGCARKLCAHPPKWPASRHVDFNARRSP
jgi:hypothetical protein